MLDDDPGDSMPAPSDHVPIEPSADELLARDPRRARRRELRRLMQPTADAIRRSLGEEVARQQRAAGSTACTRT